jgi:hypothetical protein
MDLAKLLEESFFFCSYSRLASSSFLAFSSYSFFTLYSISCFDFSSASFFMLSSACLSSSLILLAYLIAPVSSSLKPMVSLGGTLLAVSSQISA